MAPKPPKRKFKVTWRLDRIVAIVVMSAFSVRANVVGCPHFVSIADRGLVGVLGESDKVSHAFRPDGRSCASNSRYAFRLTGTFQSDQGVIPVLIQKNADQYDPSDLLQNWKNGAEYIFLELKDDVDELESFMKANEMDGAKSVHFVFANSPPEGPQTSNHIAINVSGFSNGFDAFRMACASSQ